MPYAHDLTDDEKRELLRIARATLKEFLMTGRVPPGAPHRKSMTDPAGVFVALSQAGKPRGAIGTMSADRPLYKAIQEMAVAAATRDPRFAPVDEDELDKLTIEISVLGPRVPIRGADEIVIGTHGLVIEIGEAHGLLLPQVATEAGWDAPTFLEKVCAKAGLAPDRWSTPGAQLEAFTAQVFNEKEYPPKPRTP